MLAWTGIGAVLVVALLAGVLWRRREARRKLLAEHSIEVAELHRLLGQEGGPRVYDVRQPLDLLAHSEVIPGSTRISPKEVMADPGIIPRDVETVVYCTCPGDKTARQIVEKALGLGFVTIRILKGGLEAWKAGGFPVERYSTAFHLDTPG